MKHRRGIAAAGLVLIGLVLAAATLVMALSQQATTAKSVYAAHVQGRYCNEMAESAIEECLADFRKAFAAGARDQNLRERLLAKGAGGAVFGGDIVGQESWTYAPKRTLAAVADLTLGFSVSPVVVRPLSYGLQVNFGEVELAATASFPLTRERKIYRRVRSKFYFTIDSSGVVRVLPVGVHTAVDRSPDA
jgi:hypothetical protein